MSKNNIQVVPTVLYAAADLNRLSKIEKSLRTHKSWQRFSSIHAGKFNGKVNYKPRSYRSYKIPRKIKIKLKNRLRKQVRNTTDREEALKLCRKHRRKLQRQSLYQDPYTKDWIKGQKRTNLLTHGWHAKRMVMKSIEGVKQPIKNCAYGYKSLSRVYKAANTPVPTLPARPLVSDLSLQTPIEVKATRLVLKRIFQRLLDPSHPIIDQLYDQRKPFSKEFTLLAHELNGFPLKPLGPVQTLLHCIRINNDSPKKKNCETKETVEGENEYDDIEEPGSFDLFQVLFFPHPFLFDELFLTLEAIKKELETHLSLSFLHSVFSINIRDDLVKFRFYGKSSQAFLLEYFSKYSKADNLNFLQNLLSDSNTLTRVWKDGCVFSSSIQDPRFSEGFLDSTTPGIGEEKKKKNFFQWKNSFSNSPLWGKQQTQTPVTSKAIYTSINNKKSFLWSKLISQYKSSSSYSLEPITLNNLSDIPSALSPSDIPLLLIQHQKEKQIHLSSKNIYGFSLILPSSMASVVWKSIFSFKISGGFKPVALGEEEVHHLQKVNGVLTFPYDYIDTSIGKKFWKQMEEDKAALNEKMPTDKKIYNNFNSDMKKIFFGQEEFKETKEIEETKDQPEETKDQPEVSVVRVYKYITDFQPPQTIVKDTWFLNAQELLSQLSPIKVTKKMRLPSQDKDTFVLQALPPLPTRLHIQISLTPLSRGCIQRGAVLFCPSQEDLVEYIKTSTQIQLKSQHQREKENEEKKEDESEEDEDTPGKVSKWRGFHATSNQHKFLSDASLRKPLGYITSGHQPHTLVSAHAASPFSLSFEDKIVYNLHNPAQDVHALGFLAIQDYFSFLPQSYGKFDHPLAHRLLLFRNPNSSYFRPAIFSIL